jgi:hypothetical protein
MSRIWRDWPGAKRGRSRAGLSDPDQGAVRAPNEMMESDPDTYCYLLQHNFEKSIVLGKDIEDLFVMREVNEYDNRILSYWLQM